MGRGGGGGGGGGRIRFRASKSGQALDSQDELGRQLRNGTSKFSGINAGCFYKSSGMYCPGRLTDYYCVMWSQASAEPEYDSTAAAAASSPLWLGNSTASAVSLTSAVDPTWTIADQPLVDIDICAGDFADKIIVQLNCVLPLLLLLAGTVLNILTARIAMGYCDRQLPVCFHLVVLCVVDTILLYYRQLDLWLQSAFDVKLTLSLLLMDESACQLMNMLYSSLHHFKSMLQIAMAVDARRLVVSPLRCVERYSAEWVKNSLILMCVVLVLVNGHHLWTLAVVKESAVGELDRVYHCGWGVTWPVTELFTTWLWPMTDLLLGDLVPLFAVLWAAGSGYRHLWRWSSRDRRSNNLGNGGNRSLSYHIIDARLFRRVSLSLLACSLAYAALQSPSALHSCIMYARFLAASLAAQASGARSLGQFYDPANDEWRLFVSRLCWGLQPIANSLLMLACVPHYRRDAARLLSAASSLTQTKAKRRQSTLRRTQNKLQCMLSTSTDTAEAVVSVTAGSSGAFASRLPAAADLLSINRKQQQAMLTAV